VSAFPESGFAALGSELPRQHDPRNWLVWHFTHVDNLAASFVDFDLLCQKWWGKTTEDKNRPSRRAAEVLVLDQLPIEMITHVAAKSEASRESARSAFESVGGVRQYRLEPGFYYD
jgi:hypothetical protein